jgi:Zn-dependent protease with chaperone function
MTFHALGATLAFGLFFVLTVALSPAVPALWRLAPPLTPGTRARRRADVLFALRLLPAGLAAALVGGVFLPAWLLHEPRDTAERAGPALLAAALAGLALVGAALVRATRDLARTRAMERLWRARAEPLAWPATAGRGAGLTGWRVAWAFPVVSVVGFRHPRVFVERRVLEACEPDEMAAMLAHEAGHVRARDNARRLLFRAVPDVIALTPLGGRLERDWSAAAEAAADEHAAEQQGALAVAAALVRLARLAPLPAGLPMPSGLAGSGLHGGAPIAARVERLLAAPPAARREAPPRRAVLLAAAAALVAAVPPVLPAAHALTERLVAWLG